MDNEKAEGWGDGSAAKVLAGQAGGLNPYPQDPHKIWAWQCVSRTLVLGRETQDESQG